jgi:hypothetical protein
MQVRQALIAITNDARGWLKAWAQDFDQSEATNSGGTRTNPVAWQLGHIAATQDDVYMLFTGKPGAVAADLRAVCGNSCPEPTTATRYPSLAALWEHLGRTHAQLVGLVEQSSDADLDRPPLQENPFFKSLGQSVYEIALHENYHVGMVATLRKALGKKKIG